MPAWSYFFARPKGNPRLWVVGVPVLLIQDFDEQESGKANPGTFLG
jgi:hypothetical protein